MANDIESAASELWADVSSLWTGYISTPAGAAAYLQYAENTNVATDGTYVTVVGEESTPGSGVITYLNSDGSEDVYTGGAIVWRANNPGDLTYGPTAVKAGAIGYYTVPAYVTAEGVHEPAHDFAIFANVTAGTEAVATVLIRLMVIRQYKGLFTVTPRQTTATILRRIEHMWTARSGFRRLLR